MALVTDLTARRLELVLATAQAEGRVPSMAAALTRDGSLVWRGSRGDETGVPGMRPVDLQYRIGSLTKTMTAVLVMRLRDEGRLHLHDPLSAYLPELAGSDVTVHAVLSHGAGLAAEPPGPWWERVEGGTFADLAAAFTASVAPFEPGFTHHYSNLGYGLLGELVARVSGADWWACVTERILEPLGMLRTSYDAFEPHAQGYSVAPFAPVLTEEPAADTRAMAPAGQVWSTVLDLATYADFLITGHPEVLSPDTIAEMSTPQTGSAAGGLSTGYGLGVRLLPGGTGTLVGHTGSMPGFQAALFVDRARRTGAVVLANSTAGLRTTEIAPDLLATLEEMEPALPDPWVPVDRVPAEVADLLGVWFWGNTARVLSWDGSHLLLTDMGTGRLMDSFRLGDDGLIGVLGHHDGEPLEVVRGDDGRVRHLEMSTFVLTRTPYDPGAPIPGGVPPTGPAVGPATGPATGPG